MPGVRRSALWLTALVAGLLFLACGGGGGSGGPQGNRITDPALVPTSTPIQNPAVYKISGDVVQVVGGTPTTIPNSGGTPVNGRREYTVVEGDSCAGIAAKLGISLDQLLAANRTIDRNCANLSIGQKLVIPSSGTPPPGSTAPATTRTPTPGAAGTSYTVLAGDTCAAITAKLSTTFEALRAANPAINADCSNLQPGQVLKKP